MLHTEILKNVRYNFTVNVLDGTFFGLGLGFASFVTVIPLFISTLTNDTVLIGLVASFHTIGWFLPQLLTAQYVYRLRRYKRMVMMMTFHERWPFFALAAVAFAVPTLGKEMALFLALLFVLWHSLGGGMTATAWQSMIGKIIPQQRRGTFWGIQSGAANLLVSGGALGAGFLLDKLPYPLNFAACFFIAGMAMMLSMGFLGLTREPESPRNEETEKSQTIIWGKLWEIVKKDSNFRWLLAARTLSQVTWMATSFYTIFAVRQFSMGDQTAGIMTGIMALGQTLANPILGYVGDKWGHRPVLAFGTLLMSLSAGMAMLAPELSWFYVVFGLAGFANASVWAIAMALTIQFGKEHEKPLYIGLANTSIAPMAIIAPLLGGWLADTMGFQATFLVSAVSGLVTAFILFYIVQNPRQASVEGNAPAPKTAEAMS